MSPITLTNMSVKEACRQAAPQVAWTGLTWSREDVASCLTVSAVLDSNTKGIERQQAGLIQPIDMLIPVPHKILAKLLFAHKRPHAYQQAKHVTSKHICSAHWALTA